MFVWFVKVKIDRCLHLSNSFLYMFPLPVCFKRSFFYSAWLFVEGYMENGRGRRKQRQTTFGDGVGSKCQIQIPKYRPVTQVVTFPNYPVHTPTLCTPLFLGRITCRGNPLHFTPYERKIPLPPVNSCIKIRLRGGV